MRSRRFPNPPFRFETEDQDLVRYVQSIRIRYLEPRSRSLIGKLDPSVGLDRQRPTLKQLWPAILTDALRGLKRHDTREWRSDAGIDFDSFFNEESLGMKQLETVLEAFGEYESLMYGARPDRYRDHIAHAFRVWVIGHGFLKKCFQGRLTTDSVLDKTIRLDEWECIWAIAALCHDIGYPLTALEHINQRTREALKPQGLHPAGDLQYVFSPRLQLFHETLLRLMSSSVVPAPTMIKGRGKRYLTHLQNKYYLKFLNSFDLLQHGVISALVVGKSLVYFLESDFCHDARDALSEEDAKQFLIRREILRAIAAHTCPHIYHLRFDSLAFLLFIVDELQCWGRPTFEQLRSGLEAQHDDQVSVLQFKRDHVHIQVVAEGEWQTRKDTIKAQFNRIRQRLRLAVDTRMLKDLTLRHEVVPSSGGGGRVLELSKGKVTER